MQLAFNHLLDKKLDKKEDAHTAASQVFPSLPPARSPGPWVPRANSSAFRRVQENRLQPSCRDRLNSAHSFDANHQVL